MVTQGLPIDMWSSREEAQAYISSIVKIQPINQPTGQLIDPKPNSELLCFIHFIIYFKKS